MKKNFLYKILAITLLGVFIFNTIPREFIHQFSDHHDTKDTPVSHEITAFTVKHQHCGFLNIEPEPYENVPAFYQVLVQHIIWNYASPYMPVARYTPFKALSLRAPPAIAFTV